MEGLLLVTILLSQQCHHTQKSLIGDHIAGMTAPTTISIPALAVPLYCEVLISIFYSVKRSINLTNTANFIVSLTGLY